MRPFTKTFSLALFWSLSTLFPVLAQSTVRSMRVPDQLTAQGIPSFTRHQTLAQLDAPAWKFLGWHPVQREMLVLAAVRGVQQLHRLRAPGANLEPLTTGSQSVSDAQWEPHSGRYAVLTRDFNGDEAFRLYRIDADAAAGEGMPLTPRGTRVKEYAFQPDGGGLYYLKEQLDKAERKTEGPGGAASWVVWVNPLQPESTRVLADVTGGRFTGLKVTPQGDAIVVRTIGQRSQTLRIRVDGTTTTWLGDAPDVQEPGELDDSEWLWGTRVLDGDFRRLTRLNLKTGKSVAVGPQPEADIEALAVPPVVDGRPLLAVVNDAGISRLRVLPTLETGLFTPVAATLPDGVVRNPKWHAQLPELGFHLVWSKSPAQLYSWNLKTDTVVPWSRADESTSVLPTKVLRWKSFDGLEITALHTAPPASFERPRPVFIELHGGPASQARPGYLSATLRALVEQQGVHLIRPNVRGSDGFGKQFLALDNGRLRENATRDVSSLLDFITTLATMDATRVVVAGGSYGGYLSLAVAAAESDRLAGSICRVGVSNFVSFLENTESYRRDNRRREYGDEREPAMRQFLTDISPLSRVKHMIRPMFIVHGRNDPRVPYSEAENMVGALRNQGTQVWFLTAEDEGHSFTKPANRDYLHQTTLEFVKRVMAREPLAPTQN